MTPIFDTVNPGPTEGLFRPADHVLVLPQGSAIAILDLDRGVMYATTPQGAESWSTLVGGARPRHRTVAERRSEAGEDEDHHARAQVAGYLFDRCIIELAQR